MKNRIIEILIILAITLLLGKGLLFATIAGLVLSIIKLIYNKIVTADLQARTPFESAANGAVAGLIALLINILI
jgi:uncharacterized membrane protein